MARPFWRPELTQCACLGLAKTFVHDAELLPEFLKRKLGLWIRTFASDLIKILLVDLVRNPHELLIAGFVSAH